MNYKVYQGTELKQTVTSKTAVMNGLQPNRTYDFSVQADTGNRDGTNLLIGTGQDIVIDDTANTGNQGWNFKLFNLTQQLKVGDQITVSAEGMLTGRGDLSAYDAVLFDPNTVYNRSDTKSLTAGKRSSVTLKVTNLKGTGDTVLLIYAGHAADTEGKKIVINNLKVQFGSVASTSVTTRGVRFNIPKTLTVGSTITLRYEEYPLGIVPIGNEPSGMFGGGNKQNLSAKVISTANGSSVVEVAGNVIDVGGKNLLTGSGYHSVTGTNVNGYLSNETTGDLQTLFQGLGGQTVTASVDYKYSGFISGRLGWEVSIATDTTAWNGAWCTPNNDSGSGRMSKTFMIPKNISYVGEGMGYIQFSGSGTGTVSHLKIEQGDIATPYASFVDGDTFTAQPDGTCALFSEHKALYY